MYEKTFIGIFGGITIIAIAIPTYNNYVLQYVRYKKIMNKLDNIDEQLKKIKKPQN